VIVSTAAAAVNPGEDLTYFSADDASASSGAISRVRFGRDSLAQTTAETDFGLIAAGPITPFRLVGQLIEAPFQLDQFHVATVGLQHLCHGADERLIVWRVYVVPRAGMDVGLLQPHGHLFPERRDVDQLVQDDGREIGIGVLEVRFSFLGFPGRNNHIVNTGTGTFQCAWPGFN